MPTVRRIALIVRRVAALPSSQDLTGPSLGDEPCVLKGRCGGTDEFLGRGVLFPQSPWTSVQGGRPLDKCLVQRHADAVWRKLPAAVSEAVKRSPVITTRKEDYSSLVRGAPVDRRGHIRVRRSSYLSLLDLRIVATSQSFTSPRLNWMPPPETNVLPSEVKASA